MCTLNLSLFIHILNTMDGAVLTSEDADFSIAFLSSLKRYAALSFSIDSRPPFACNPFALRALRHRHSARCCDSKNAVPIEHQARSWSIEHARARALPKPWGVDRSVSLV